MVTGMKVFQEERRHEMAITLWILFVGLTYLSVTFLLLPPRILRRLNPWWPWVEAEMWRSKVCCSLLRNLRGPVKYQGLLEEWTRYQASKVGGVG